MAKKQPKTDPRVTPVSTDILRHIAGCGVGGSGEGSYITGRIQSMAREILQCRGEPLDENQETADGRG